MALSLFLKNDNKTGIVDPVVLSTEISPSADNAILTLGDGSQIDLTNVSDKRNLGQQYLLFPFL